MRILKLTSAVEKSLLHARLERDREAESIAARIIADVRKRGNAALFAYTNQFDSIDLRREGVWVTLQEMRAARSKVSSDFLRAVRQAARNIRRVAEKQLPRAWTIEVEPGVKISQRVSPIESVGCYIPGGNFALVSTLLMTAIPAQIVGVSKIVAVCPHPNDALLAAADFLGITKIARIGGAHAIAALAYGTKSIERVEKICGPGNRFVTAAKQLVSSDCAIDLPAGPTEAIVLAAKGNPKWVAADLLAQAEHAPDAGSFLVTPSMKLARAVQEEVQSQLSHLPPNNPAHQSMRKTGAILLAPSLEAACVFCNRFAPEHLSLPDDPAALLEKITAAGTIFLGPWGAQPLGDYVSGSNHVLPTGGWAHKRGGLSAADFVKCISVQTISNKGFLRLADAAESLAESEGLLAHRNAVRIRR
ncbi:MAG TPA: histidinol dehydrogenase [Verrucomicrobiae bacterium]|jgi:histidinol dehydrogenase|nr:histidinol dehydrogenase [Verrucomicrobiae bacterium]